ncbi:MAG: DNA-binding response regulator [Ramlibacter sp.]|jgi:DNA-binding NarL/FixJ family response regulator|nr:DNA-binding response regulator [Ramlibacter sp.]
MRTSVLIVEDEPEFLLRFSDAVMATPGLHLVAAVSSGRAGQAILDAERPDVMLIDLGLPDVSGIDVIRYAASRHPGCECLVVTMFSDDQHVMASIEAGATGYLLKDAAAESIAASIHQLHAGGSPISPSIARRVLARFHSPALPVASAATQPASGPSRSPSPLTERETELLRLTAKGLSFESIGDVMGISPHTVVAHVKKIYRKLAVHSRGEAVYEAGQLGLL